tara:strand:- start:141 stop:272 length:132 start_codon:yes stop_codon:yes gene_type:complete
VTLAKKLAEPLDLHVRMKDALIASERISKRMVIHVRTVRRNIL